MNDPVWIKTVGVENNGDFISIQAYSGYDSIMVDPTAIEYFFVADVSNEVLGEAVLESFKQCRFLSYEEAHALAQQADQFYIDWVQRVTNHYGYKTREELFINMKCCLIEHHKDALIFLPSHHEELEVWVDHGEERENNLKISVNSSAAEIGAMLRLAFDRCTS